MSKEIQKLKDLIEHHKIIKDMWEKKAEFFADYLKENFGLINDQLDYIWNEFVLKHWDDEREKTQKQNIIRLFPADGKGK